MTLKMLCAALLLLGCALACGCGGKVYPGNHDVRLELDDCVASKGASLVREGAAFWDVVGGRFKVGIDSPYVLPIYCEKSLDSDPNVAARYVSSKGVIEVKESILTDYADSPELLRVVFAHEISHAMGLQHVSDVDNVMYPWDSGVTHLGKQDIEEYQKLWGSNGAM